MHKRPLYFFPLILLFCLTGSLFAQENTPAQAIITEAEIASPPAIDLQVYGYAQDGSAIDFSNEAIGIQHNGVTATTVVAGGTVEVGTLTIFLIDIPTGVTSQLPLLQESITEFATAPTMKEQVDYVAIYQVGATEAIELLAPEPFYNGVRNFFTTSLVPATGATALVDSLGSLINNAQALKPDPHMAVSIVVMTDGTDSVSTRFTAESLAGQALGNNVAVHTVWLRNEALSQVSQSDGQGYLQTLAGSAWGATAALDDPPAMANIWQQIARFRDQQRLTYVAPDLRGGQANIVLTLPDAAQATAQVTVPDNVPFIQIDIPSDQRTLTLPNTTDPITLNIPTTLSWLDGEERTLEAAQLQVNGEVVADILVDELSQFEVELTNMTFGLNSLQIAILDSQGIRATSPPIELTINEGAEEIPQTLAPAGGTSFFVWLLLLVVLFGLALFGATQAGLLTLPIGTKPKRQRHSPPPKATTFEAVETPVGVPYTPEDSQIPQTIMQPQTQVAYLEVLQTETADMPHEIGLTRKELVIGRSPNQSDLPFENDITVSRQHARLVLDGKAYRIFDLQSTSGTLVNGREVAEFGHHLRDGDEIQMGKLIIRYHRVEG